MFDLSGFKIDPECLNHARFGQNYNFEKFTKPNVNGVDGISARILILKT